jgi:polar amino acid transport system substrate-binding protein
MCRIDTIGNEERAKMLPFHFPRRKFLALTGTAATLMMSHSVFADEGPKLTGGDGSFDRVKKAGTLVFGTSNDQPYNFLDPKTGQMAGIDSEMLAYVLKKLGIPNSKMVQADFSGLVPGLISSRFDTIADAMYITPKRLQVIAFSDGLYRYGEVLVVQKGNPKGLHTLDDLTKGVRAASYTGTAYQDWLDALAPKGAKITTYPAVPELLQDLKFGRIDAGLIDAPVAAYILKQQPDLGAAVEVVSDYKPKEIGTIGCGFRKEDVDLRQAFNWALTSMKKEDADLAILRKWGLNEQNRAPVTAS